MFLGVLATLSVILSVVMTFILYNEMIYIYIFEKN
jgi:hypothetical protein